MRKFTIWLTCLLFFASMGLANAQTKVITGKVTGADDGLPIPGVTIAIPGTSTGTVTDINGNYQITLDANVTTLRFSYVGMTTQDVEIGNRTVINVVMKFSVTALDEVIVVAYGTTTKKSFTGSATSVKTEKLEKLSVTNVSSALQGNATGVQVISSSGQPGTDATIRIRGIGSINASSNPLYVVDGVPFGGSINSIQPSDIESMTVLKDAAATALYGSRGANGVIMITTKKGKKGKAKVNIKVSHGISSKAVEDYETVGAADYYKLIWTALKNKKAGEGDPNPAQWATDNVVTTLGYNPFSVAKPIDTNGEVASGAELLWDTDWMDAILDNGQRSEYIFDVSGGTENTNYYMSLGYLKNEGIVPVSDFERFNARVNLDMKVNEWFKTGINIAGSTSNQNYPNTAGSSYSNMIQFGRNVAPIYPIYLRNTDGTFILNDDESKIFDYGQDGDQDGRGARPTDGYPNTNVLGGAMLDKRLYERDNVSLRTYMEAQIIEGLTFRSNFSYDYYVYNRHEYANPDFGYAKSYGGFSYKARTKATTYTFNNLLTYDKNFGDHNINLLGGHEAYKYTYYYLFASGSAFPFAGLEELDAAAATQDISSYRNDHRIQSFLGRAEYNYAGKYYLSASYRRDGSSRFHEDYRWGDFWSLAGSWRMSEENFMKSINWIDNMKVRASYGTLGNDALNSGFYAYQGLYSTGYNNLSDAGLLINKLENQSITWEVSKTMNIGLEVGILNKFNFEFEFFNRKVEDMLFARPLPNSTGITSIDENVADMKNVGFEGSIFAQLITNKDFKWSIDLNFTHYKNTITKLPEDSKEIISGSKKLMEGHSYNEFFIQEYAGVDPDNGDALWYKDVYELDSENNPVLDDNGDKIVIGRETTNEYSEADKYYVGKSLPDLYGGITNNLSYKGFDLSVFVYYSLGGKILDGDYQQLTHSGLRYGGSMSVDMLNAWAPDNTTSDIPRIDAGTTDANSRSSRYLVDASYLRLRNVTLGYTLPKSITQKIHFDKVRLYVSADNLFTIFGTDGLDPEVNVSGTTNNRYPQLKTVTFGINVSF